MDCTRLSQDEQESHDEMMAALVEDVLRAHVWMDKMGAPRKNEHGKLSLALRAAWLCGFLEAEAKLRAGGA